jgi:hypothetical protein
MWWEAREAMLFRGIVEVEVCLRVVQRRVFPKERFVGGRVWLLGVVISTPLLAGVGYGFLVLSDSRHG